MDNNCKQLRYLIYILLLISAIGCKAQCDTTKIDTLKMYFHTTDTVWVWYYYNKNGGILWKSKTMKIDSSLIPPSGFAGKYYTSLKPYAVVSGYGVVRWDFSCNMIVLRRLDANLNDIKNNIIHPAIMLR